MLQSCVLNKELCAATVLGNFSTCNFFLTEKLYGKEKLLQSIAGAFQTGGKNMSKLIWKFLACPGIDVNFIVPQEGGWGVGATYILGGSTPTLALCLVRNSQPCHLEILDLFLKIPDLDLNVQFGGGTTALLLACEEGILGFFFFSLQVLKQQIHVDFA